MATKARPQAQTKKLTLLVAANKTGYCGVYLNNPGQPKPYQARVQRGGKRVSLGSFATAEEAALCVARTPEGQAAAAERAAAAVPLTSEEARQQAQAEKLTLLVADNKSGYFGVHLNTPGLSKTYVAQVWRGGKTVHLGRFATAEEAALCVARSPEGQAAAAERAAAPTPLTSEEARQQAQAEKLTLLVAENKTGYFGVHLGYPNRPKPYQAKVWRGGIRKDVSLGYFATAEEAALCVARAPEGRAAAARAAAADGQGAPPPGSSSVSRAVTARAPSC
jgi:predicted secreted protein